MIGFMTGRTPLPVLIGLSVLALGVGIAMAL